MVQLLLFAHTHGQGPAQPGGVPIPPPESKAHLQEEIERLEEPGVLDPFDLLGLNPLLADVSSDATGIMMEPAWSAVFATQNLLDHLGFGVADQQESYEQRLYDVICRARLELELVGPPGRLVPFYYHTDRANLRLALIVREEFLPPAAVIGLAEDFPLTEREKKHE